MKRFFGNNLRSLLGWRDVRAEVTEEMALHVDLRTSELESKGVPPALARQQAQREVGHADHVLPAVARQADAGDRRSALGQRWDELHQDVRHALRVFRASPGFSLLAILTIRSGSVRMPRSSRWSTRCSSVRCRSIRSAISSACASTARLSTARSCCSPVQSRSFPASASA